MLYATISCPPPPFFYSGPPTPHPQDLLAQRAVQTLAFSWQLGEDLYYWQRSSTQTSITTSDQSGEQANAKSLPEDSYSKSRWGHTPTKNLLQLQDTLFGYERRDRNELSVTSTSHRRHAKNSQTKEIIIIPSKG